MDDLIASFLEAATSPGADQRLLLKFHETAMLGVIQYSAPHFSLSAKPGDLSSNNKT